MSFENMKRNRAKATEDLTKKLTEMNKSGYESDQRFWYPKRDKAGNASAVIRFLPASDGEDVPFVRVFSHNFKGPTGLWYSENSLTTLGQDDPVGEFNTKLWNSTTDEESPARKQASAQKRKLSYYSNILVLKDPATPENEGKVFLFSYGVKIMGKLNEAMNGDPSVGLEPFNPFDYWEGADFYFKVRTVDKQVNYDSSSFANPAPLYGGDDEKLKKVYEAQYKLQEFLAASQFKSYDELKARMEKVLCLDGTPVVSRASKPVETAKETPAKEEKKAPAPKLPEVDVGDGDGEEAMDFLKNLMKE